MKEQRPPKRNLFIQRKLLSLKYSLFCSCFFIKGQIFNQTEASDGMCGLFFFHVATVKTDVRTQWNVSSHFAKDKVGVFSENSDQRWSEVAELEERRPQRHFLKASDVFALCLFSSSQFWIFILSLSNKGKDIFLHKMCISVLLYYYDKNWQSLKLIYC